MKTLTVANIREHWNWVRPGLVEVARENDAAWLPEDIYSSVQAGTASLLLAEGDTAGFLVAQVYTEALGGPKVFYIIAAFHPAGNAQQLYGEAVDETARELGCDVIEFGSLRRGFERQGGWEIDRIVYRRRLNYG